MLLSSYPGLTRAESRLKRAEDVLRIFAMTSLLERINGLPVLQLTARHIDLLHLVRSPFILDKETRGECSILIRPEQVAQFLWIVAPANPLNQSTLRRFLTWPVRPWLRALFMRRFRKHPGYLRFERAIDRYYARATLDKPGSGGGRAVPTTISVAMVHRIASAYGWPSEVLDCFGLPVIGRGILDMPLARLYQYRRWIRVEANPRAPLRSKLSGAVALEIIRRWEARAAAKGVTVEELIASLRDPKPADPVGGAQ